MGRLRRASFLTVMQKRGGTVLLNCVITCTSSEITKLSPFEVMVTFTDPTSGLPVAVTGFVAGSITVDNGSAGNLVEVSDGVYTADITPTAEGDVTVSVAAGVVGNNASNSFAIYYDPYLVALLHLNSDLTDKSGKIWTARNGADINTSIKKFGAGSLNTTRGATQKYIDTPDHADFHFGTGAFTIAQQIYSGTVPASGYAYLCGQYVDAGNYWRLSLYRGAANQWTHAYLDVYTGGVQIINKFFVLPSPITADGLFHLLELGRSGNNFYIFLDGVVSSANPQADADGIPDYAAVFTIGTGLTSSGLDGCIDEVYIRKGICMHTTAYTPPTTEYP